jgi:lipoic acid synthetase
VATFLLLGGICTRQCRFCAVDGGCPAPPDPREPERLAEAVRQMELRHAVLTSVTRDDLDDGGAAHWRLTVEAVRAMNPGISIEVLLPDFAGSSLAFDHVIASRPEIVAHNLETVPRLTPEIRSGASFERSLAFLKRAKGGGHRVKTGLMLGMGETRAEIGEVVALLASEGIAILSLGQYLQPTSGHLPVDRWVTPDEFAEWKSLGESLGIGHIESGPMVRSSYQADRQSAALVVGERYRCEAVEI